MSLKSVLRVTLTTFALAGVMSPAMADDVDLRFGGTQEDFDLAMQDLQAAFSFKPLAPAEPLGITGFHAGLIASYTGIENEQAWRNISGGQDFEDLGMVAIAAGKGLPFGIDIGAFIADVPNSNVNLFGAELRYAFAEGGVATPAIGLRLAYTRLNGVDELDFDTKSIDISISKGFTLLTPYVGVGRVFSSATPHVEDPVLGVPAYRKSDNSDNKFYGGVRISLTLLQVSAEIDQTGENTSYNLRLALGF